MIADVPDADDAAGSAKLRPPLPRPGLGAHRARRLAQRPRRENVPRRRGGIRPRTAAGGLGFSRLTHEAAWVRRQPRARRLRSDGARACARLPNARGGAGATRPSSGNEDAPAPDETPLLSEAASRAHARRAQRRAPKPPRLRGSGKRRKSHSLQDRHVVRPPRRVVRRPSRPSGRSSYGSATPSGRPRANLAGANRRRARSRARQAAPHAEKRAVVRIARGGVEKSRALPALRRAARTMVPAENDRPCYKKRHEHAEPCRLHAMRGGEIKILWPERARALLRLARKAPQRPRA